MMINMRRSKGESIIPVQDFDPALTIESFRAESAKAAANEKTKAEISEEHKVALRAKMDRQHYKEFHQKQNK